MGLTAANAEPRKEYIPYGDIERGTEGVTEVTLSVENNAASVVRCSASLAHWYSMDLGDVGPGATLKVSLWHNPATGSLDLLNAARDRMPIEAIWCGHRQLAGRTRTRVHLPHSMGEATGGLSYTCAAVQTGGLKCNVSHRDDPAGQVTAP